MDNTEFRQLSDETGRCIIDAGSAILEVYSKDFEVDEKEDNSPITEADRRAHEIIRSGLSKVQTENYGSLPLLSEEGEHGSFGERKTWQRYWLVDPLDGTKEFVGRNGEFTVNIALIENGLPRYGWVYVPVTDILYFGDAEGGACRLDSASKAVSAGLVSKARKIGGGVAAASKQKLRVVASRSHLNEGTKNYIDRLAGYFGKDVETVQAGSSLKLCRIAEGEADVYPRFGPTMEWDTAAAHAICRASHCSVREIEKGMEMRYNKEDLHNPHFIAAPAGLIEDCLSLANKFGK